MASASSKGGATATAALKSSPANATSTAESDPFSQYESAAEIALPRSSSAAAKSPPSGVPTVSSIAAVGTQSPALGIPTYVPTSRTPSGGWSSANLIGARQDAPAPLVPVVPISGDVDVDVDDEPHTRSRAETNDPTNVRDDSTVEPTNVRDESQIDPITAVVDAPMDIPDSAATNVDGNAFDADLHAPLARRERAAPVVHDLLAAADAAADSDPDDGQLARESAPALPPPPVTQSLPVVAIAARPATNNDRGGIAEVGPQQKSRGGLFAALFGGGRTANSSATEAPRDWATGSSSVTTPGVVARLMASPKRLAIGAGAAALLLVAVLVFAFTGSNRSAAPKTEKEPERRVVMPAAPVEPPPAPPVVETPPPVVEEPPAPKPVAKPRPKTVPKPVVKKPATKRAATTKPATTTKPAATKQPAVTKKPATTKKPTTTTAKPKWDPDSLFPTKKK